MVECLSHDGAVAVSSLASITALWSCAKHTDPCLVLVLSRKTCPDKTKNVDLEVLNQIKQTILKYS